MTGCRLLGNKLERWLLMTGCRLLGNKPREMTINDGL